MVKLNTKSLKYFFILIHGPISFYMAEWKKESVNMRAEP